MSMVLAGVEYTAAVLVGLVIAFIATGLIDYAVFPDGPVGEGIALLFIYFVSSCACVPGYTALMKLHRQGGRRDTRGLIACEVILRISFAVAACLICFLAIKLPMGVVSKWLTCLAAAPAGAWAIKPTSVP